jgi:hypothetical protein
VTDSHLMLQACKAVQEFFCFSHAAHAVILKLGFLRP